MPTIPQRIACDFAVLCGQYGDVTKMAKGREQSRQSLYREAEQVANGVDGTAAQARIDQLQHQLADRQAEVQALRERLEHAVEITPETWHEFATGRPGRGGQLERRPVALAGREGVAIHSERARPGAGDP